VYHQHAEAGHAAVDVEMGRVKDVVVALEMMAKMTRTMITKAMKQLWQRKRIQSESMEQFDIEFEIRLSGHLAPKLTLFASAYGHATV